MNSDIFHVKFPYIGWSFTINRVALQIGSFKIYWYGVIIMTGMLLAVLYAYKSSKRYNVDRNKLFNCVFVGLISGIIGARLYFCIFRWDYYSQHLDEILSIHEGGLAIYGGIIGALLGGLIVAKIQKMKFMPILDISMMGFLIGQGIGRWGNFMNREAFGGYTNGLFAMRLPIEAVRQSDISADIAAHIVEGTNYIQVHPTFLYESFLNLCLFIIMLLYRKHKRFDGEMALFYLGGYGIIRFFVEGLRTDQLQIGTTGIAVSQMLGLGLFAVSVIVAVIMHIRVSKKAKAA